jgi:trimeric autotransporter adhesin
LCSGDGSSNVALGDHSDAHGAGSKNTAVGANAVATGNNSSAFGAGAQAAFINSAAFGAGAVASRANQVVLGTTTNTYTLPGLTSAASNSAQSGTTQVVTTDAQGNLGTVPLSGLGGGGGGAPFDPSALTAAIGQMDHRVNKAFTGVAMSFAMAGVPTVLPNEKFVFTLNWGTFQGENGSAVSAAFRIYKNVQANASFAYGFRENMGGARAGLRFGF